MPTETASIAPAGKLRPDEVVRRQERQSHRQQLEREVVDRMQEGRYPFEGGWYTLEQIEAKRRDMRRSDRVILLELFALFVVMLAGGLLPVVLLAAFLLP